MPEIKEFVRFTDHPPTRLKHPELMSSLARTTEAAAMVAARAMGRADAERVRDVASTAMLEALEDLDLTGHVILGPRDNQILSRGSTVGSGSRSVELAAYPVEGASLVARGLPGAISVAAAVEPGGFPRLPAVWYMEGLIAGPEAVGAVDLDEPLRDNLQRLAFARDVRISDLTVAVLDRPRHQKLIAEVQQAGARLLLIEEGEIAGALMAALDDQRGRGIAAMVGISGLQEMVIAAGIVRCLGGEIQARLWPRNDEERELAAEQAGKIFGPLDLAPETVDVSITGVSGGPLAAVWYGSIWQETETLLLSTDSMAMRRMITRYRRPSE
ncbi:MAG: fructose-bisphosphatase class II [Candidatus Dormibacteraceae bacterium]